MQKKATEPSAKTRSLALLELLGDWITQSDTVLGRACLKHFDFLQRMVWEQFDLLVALDVLLCCGLPFEKGLMETTCSCVLPYSQAEPCGESCTFEISSDKQIQWDTFKYLSMQTYHKHLAHVIVDTVNPNLQSWCLSLIQSPKALVEPGSLLWTNSRDDDSFTLKNLGAALCSVRPSTVWMSTPIMVVSIPYSSPLI